MPKKGTYGFYEKTKPLQADLSKITETFQKTKLQNEASRRADEELELKKKLYDQKEKEKNAVEWIDFADTFDSYPGDMALTAERLNAQANDIALNLYNQVSAGKITKGEYRKAIVDIENSVRSWDSITKQGNEHMDYLRKLDPAKFINGEVNGEMSNYLGYFKDSINISLDKNNKLRYKKADGTYISGIKQLALMQPKNMREARKNQFKQIEAEANVEALVTMVNGVPIIKQMTDEEFFAYVLDDSRDVSKANFGDQYETMRMWNEEDILSSGGEVENVKAASKLKTDEHLINIYKNKLAKYINDKTPKPTKKTEKEDKTVYKPVNDTNLSYDESGNANIIISRQDRLSVDPLEVVSGINIKDGKDIPIRGFYRRIYQRDKVTQGDQSYLNYKPGKVGEKEWVMKIYGATAIGFSDLENKVFLEKMGKNFDTYDLVLDNDEVQELDQKLHFLDKIGVENVGDVYDPMNIKN